MTTAVAPAAPTRREARRQDRRDAILTVAQTYFLQHGFADTTMSGIAAELGGSKGTLWNHFPSKEALFAAVVERAAKAYQARLSQILDPSSPLKQTLHRACHSLIEKITAPEASALHRLIVAQGRRFPELSQIFFDLAPQNTRLLLAEFLRGAMARGQLRSADPVDAARALMSLSMSGCHQQMLIGRIDRAAPDQIEADAAFAVDIFLRAYAPATDAPSA
ncbi:TetR/AcrR family transcriptional regulator [Sphingobium sp. CR2-8]|uniref:TetR/AcrR family transcriptional regulator n=1 Tax=Sphingobium sp. CR2-8 TaxID=1306534 RepID=UPI002DB8ADFB|nr:TetR/AcrR family transcriptional regulator [Sphingobium sp. CR2-8]MEC3912257.1 TetR/AcrR family transcriptional regulator [Sphingobium sp. CR2-8]